MILLKDDIRKVRNPKTAALAVLRSYIDKNNPKLVRLLVNNWRSQGKSFTYKDLREVLMYAREVGGLNGVTFFTDLFYEWQQDYAQFVIDVVAPSWTDAINAAANRVGSRFPVWSWDGTNAGIRQYTDERSAMYVTNSTEIQINALRHVIRRAAQVKDLNVDTLAQVIRPMVGLTKPQASANLRYFENLINNGVSERLAVERSIRYSARQSRARAYNIARTELSFAYNKGEDLAVREAIEENLLPPMRKQWCTSNDYYYDEKGRMRSRVCDICRALDGKIIEMDEEFSFPTRLTTPGIKLTPPAHPNCGCAILYIEK